MRSAGKPIASCERSRTMPGPVPLDRPAFPDEFLEECRSLVRRRTVLHCERQRARLVLLLHESPHLSNVAAGALVEQPSNSVHRWRHRFASLEDVEQRLRLYEELSYREPRPFQWKFDRA